MPDATRYKILANESSDEEELYELNSTTRGLRSRAANNASPSSSTRTESTKLDQVQLSKSSDLVYLEYTIDHKNNETLAKIAFEFRCEVADLKRWNGIQSDTDFHGKKTLKIQVSKYSSLLATPEEKEEYLNGQPARTNSPQSDTSTRSSSKTIPKILEKSTKATKEIQLKNAVGSQNEALERLGIPSFTQAQPIPPLYSEASDRFIQQGTPGHDGESVLCNWKVVLVLVILGLLVLPFLYGYQFEKEHEHSDRASSSIPTDNKYPHPQTRRSLEAGIT